MDTRTTEPQREALRRLYLEQPQNVRRYVGHLAFSLVPRSAVALNRFAKLDRQFGAGGARPLSSPQLIVILDRLVEKELLFRVGSEYGCNLLVSEWLLRNLSRKELVSMESCYTNGEIPSISWQFDGQPDPQRRIAGIRACAYRRNFVAVIDLLARYERTTAINNAPDPWLLLADRFDDAAWLREWPPALLLEALMRQIERRDAQLSARADALLRRFSGENYFEIFGGYAEEYIGSSAIVAGRFAEAEAMIGADPAPYLQAMGGLLALIRGDRDAALNRYDEATKALRKFHGNRTAWLDGVSGRYYLPLLLTSDRADALKMAQKAFDQGHADDNRQLLRLLEQRNGIRNTTPIRPLPDSFVIDIESLPVVLATFWARGELTAGEKARVLSERVRAEAEGQLWLASELAALLGAAGDEAMRARGEALAAQIGSVPLVGLFKVRPQWEQLLLAMQHVGGEVGPSKRGERLVWMVGGDDGRQLTPRLQKRTAKGSWSIGREMTLQRLAFDHPRIEALSDQDRRICLAMAEVAYHFSTPLLLDAAWPLLVGHPALFRIERPAERLDAVAMPPQLLVKQQRGQLHLSILPWPEAGERTVVLPEAGNRLRITTFEEQHLRLLAILGEKGLSVPAEGREQVLATIAAVAPTITVHSDIGGGSDAAEEVAADATPHLLLFPHGAGLKLELRSQPFPQGGPIFRPGKGGLNLFTELAGKRVQTTRDLKLEQTRAAEVVAACPVLEAQQASDDDWQIEDPESCLELVEQLQALGERARVVWPEGKSLRIAHKAGLGQLKLKLAGRGDWFEASGELQLDETAVLDMRKLLELAAATPGRFLPLAEGQYLALSHEFRRRLDELNAFGELEKQGVRLHARTAPSLEELLDGVGEVVGDKSWKAQIKRIEAGRRAIFALPPTLQAELRDYQRDGFVWLARLAEWRMGACLADDMGLGKTVQALALLLQRAKDGPALVVAPTSVCNNWIDEARKFAPTLRAILFSEADRQTTVAEAGPFDLIVSTYGLLQSEEELFAGKAWHTLILDEAQAIKNAATKRSQAAMKLQADFRMAATGTPIENHLGELWNLFRFLNPGLLGSGEHFNRRFAGPIERDESRETRQMLKKLIAPFILRRTKQQVLSELPARTEIVQRIDPSPEEVAFLEALRRQSLDRLEESKGGEGHFQLQILAELMRLRRASCHPKLVAPDSLLSGSKLAAFGEIVEELRDNGHRALVFSQFVDHLGLIRGWLDERKIAYHYLDGSTPAKERKRRVDAFQAGEGELFLISLKAGGVGLNLTGADYVIHMDPWWNPAAEDQASDRAHRIGQTRPVTIYRLVLRGSIEEKIVALHERKRDLADSLLEGSDLGARITPDELLALIRGA